MTFESPIAKIQALLKEKNKAKISRPQFWKPAGLITRITPLRHIQDWLKTSSSLTAKLKGLCSNLEVVVLSEKQEIPLYSEAQKLGLAANEEAWVRCVILRCGGNNWVYARTVIPNMSPTNPWQELQSLGNKPLGEILFEMPSIQRSAFEFSKEPIDAWPHLQSVCNIRTPIKPPTFARRSVFKQKQAPLLLTEVFLTEVLQIK